ncbi:MAG: LysM peptidoglycan-binding domain-containing M23 family metallopeptidase [Candidatus Omnitrophota bacterium]|jgi:murein DD-endopeptidase MepM/ murein hydrolase activator NlpD
MLRNNKLSVKSLVIIAYLFFLSGCVTAPYVKPITPAQSVNMPGIYHSVVKGETLWRISKMYDTDLEELVKVNRITDSTVIETGQRIFIPNRSNAKPAYEKYADNDDFIWPSKGRVVGSFGQVVNNMINKGINIAPYGSRDIIASRSGRVVFLSNNFAGLGKTIILDHGDGFFTVYSLSSEVFVKPGDTIKQGTVIARLSPSGEGKNGYLHFQVRKGHLPQNPIFYLP